MEHNIKEGLLYFSERELKLTDEKRSPVDARVAPFILKHVKDKMAAITDEVSTISTRQHTHPEVADNRRMLQRELDDLKGLETGLTTVALNYELGRMVVI